MPSQDDALASVSSEEESPTDLGKTLPMKHKAAATAAAASTHQQTVADGTKRQPPKSRRVVDSPRTMAAFAAAKQKHHPVGIGRHASAASASSLRSTRSAPAKKSDTTTTTTTTAKRGSKTASGKTATQAKKQPVQKAAPPVVPTLRVDSVQREFVSLSPSSSFRKDSPRGDGLVGGTPRGTTTAGARSTPRLRGTAAGAAAHAPNTARAVRPRLSPRASTKSPRIGSTGGAPLQRYPSAPGSPLRSSTRDTLGASSSTQQQSPPLQRTGSSGPNRDRPPPSPALDAASPPQVRRSPREADGSGTNTPTSATAAAAAAAAAAPRRRTASTSPSQRSLQIQHLMRDTYSSGIRNRSLSPFRRSSSPATLAADGGGGASGDASLSGGISPRGSLTPRTPYSRVTTTQLTPRTFANISSVASLRSQSPPAEVFVKGTSSAGNVSGVSGGGSGGTSGAAAGQPPTAAKKDGSVRLIKICALNSAGHWQQYGSQSTMSVKRSGLGGGSGGENSLVVAPLSVPSGVRSMRAVCTMASRVLGWTGKSCASRVFTLHLPNGEKVTDPATLRTNDLYVANNLKHVSSTPYDVSSDDEAAVEPAAPAAPPASAAAPAPQATSSQFGETPGCITFGVMPYAAAAEAGGSSPAASFRPISLLKSALATTLTLPEVIARVKEELGVDESQSQQQQQQPQQQSQSQSPQQTPLAQQQQSPQQSPPPAQSTSASASPPPPGLQQQQASAGKKKETMVLMTLGGTVLTHAKELQHGGLYVVTYSGIRRVSVSKGEDWVSKDTVLNVVSRSGARPAMAVRLPRGASCRSSRSLIMGALQLDPSASDLTISTQTGAAVLTGSKLDLPTGASVVVSTSPADSYLAQPGTAAPRRFSLLLEREDMPT